MRSTRLPMSQRSRVSTADFATWCKPVSTHGISTYAPWNEPCSAPVPHMLSTCSPRSCCEICFLAMNLCSRSLVLVSHAQSSQRVCAAVQQAAGATRHASRGATTGGDTAAHAASQSRWRSDAAPHPTGHCAGAAVLLRARPAPTRLRRFRLTLSCREAWIHLPHGRHN